MSKQNLQQKQNNISEKGDRREIVTIAQQTVTYSSPFPHPDILKKYEDILPGSAKDIFEIAISNSECLTNATNKMVWSNMIGELLGMIISWTVIMATLYLGWDLIKSGKDIQGFISIFGPLGAVLGTFIFVKKRK